MPAPFAGLLLADYGASVLRIDRPHTQAHTLNSPPPTSDSLARHKSSIAVDLKCSQGLAIVRDLLTKADILIEPFRPGVLESLGLNPQDLLTVNPRLIIARLTGFRRDGPYAQMAGHDINYLAVSGILSQLGRKDSPPYAPANILADFAGGGLMCAFGIVAALLSRAQTGKGQVVETNMVDGSSYLGTFMRYAMKTPSWGRPRGENLLDGGCPFYDVYASKDGGYMAVGALEPQFFAILIKSLDLPRELSSTRSDPSTWPAMREQFRRRFSERSRKEWEEVFAGKDACCTPVLSLSELEEEGYEQRSAVMLTDSPALDALPHEQWTSKGLSPGQGGEQLLEDWMCWRKERDYGNDGGSLIRITRSRL